MTENAQEFVNELNDMCSDQSSDTIRCKSAKLILEMCEHVDGLLSFVCDLSVSFIEKSIDPKEEEKIFFEAMMSNYAVTITPEQFMKVGIVTLAVLSEQIVQRKDLQLAIDNLLEQHMKTFI